MRKGTRVSQFEFFLSPMNKKEVKHSRSVEQNMANMKKLRNIYIESVDVSPSK